ncbi:14-3-3C1 protein [Achlya hypogyna]|uniref:14-3-3C1 protein n=1 Tax=Achlya hypogyna TaxID=1202772 RepID=A0A1V9YLS9_ACHHY|nr:14-3-3C1 protein [Achlya hypogyna]
MQSLATLDRPTLVSLAQLAEHAERFEDMAEIMKELVMRHKCLETSEIHLLATAYKHVIHRVRIALRVVAEARRQDPAMDNRSVTTYESELETEYERHCTEMLTLLSDYLLPAAQGHDLICLLKTQGDYHRYLAQVTSDESHLALGRQSYSEAYKLAKDSLVTTHAFRLGLALNFSVFIYEVLMAPQEAYDLAYDAFEAATLELDVISPEGSSDHLRETALTLQLIQSNLKLWIADGLVVSR